MIARATKFILYGPSYMVSGTRDNPSPDATLSEKNLVSIGPVKVNPA